MITEEFRTFHPDVIEVMDRVRGLDDAKVAEIAASIEAIGQITPIVVFSTELGDRIILVAGWHRLAAINKLGRDTIDCRIVEGDEVEYKLWEIAENLHRAELTVLERASHIEEWRKLTAEKVAQVVPPSGGAQPKESGVRATARELGVSRPEVQRSAKLARITPEAKEAAKKAGLDDNQGALLKVASYADEDQVEAVADIAKAKAEQVVTGRSRVMALENVISAAGIADKYIGRDGAPVETKPSLLAAWLAASLDKRVAFMRALGADEIIAAISPEQLRKIGLVYKTRDEQARRKGRDPEEIERVKAQDRARQSKRYAQAHAT